MSCTHRNTLGPVALAVCLLTLLFSFSPSREASAGFTQSGPPEGPEENDLPPKMRLLWDGLADDGSVLNTRGTLISLKIENLTRDRSTLTTEDPPNALRAWEL